MHPCLPPPLSNSETARKSDIYTEPNDAGERCVLLVRAALGEAHKATAPMPKALKPPERPDGRGPLNSVVALTHDQGGAVEHPEYIVYKESQALPEYAIWSAHAQPNTHPLAPVALCAHAHVHARIERRYKHEVGCLCTHCITKRVRITFVDADGVLDNITIIAGPLSTVQTNKDCLYTHLGVNPETRRITLHFSPGAEALRDDFTLDKFWRYMRRIRGSRLYYKVAPAPP